jgi:hypothetical protein
MYDVVLAHRRLRRLQTHMERLMTDADTTADPIEEKYLCQRLEELNCLVELETYLLSVSNTIPQKTLIIRN